jgi:hypothetical protein
LPAGTERAVEAETEAATWSGVEAFCVEPSGAGLSEETALPDGQIAAKVESTAHDVLT